MSVIVALVFPLTLIAAAVSDFKRLEIPNGFSAVLLMGFLVYSIASGIGLDRIGANMALGLAVLLYVDSSIPRAVAA